MLGHDVKIPLAGLDLLNEHACGSEALASGLRAGDPGYVRAMRLRIAAQKAYVDVDDLRRVRRAMVGQKGPKADHYQVGDKVFLWRRMTGSTSVCRWHGPATVIGFSRGRSKAWVAVGNRIPRCEPEQLRFAMSEEVNSHEIISPELGRLAQVTTSDGGPAGFADVSGHEMAPDRELESGEEQGGAEWEPDAESEVTGRIGSRDEEWIKEKSRRAERKEARQESPGHLGSDEESENEKAAQEKLFQPDADDDERPGAEEGEFDLGPEVTILDGELEHESSGESLKRQGDAVDERSGKNPEARDSKSSDEEETPATKRREDKWPTLDSLVTVDVFIANEVKKEGRHEVTEKNMAFEQKVRYRAAKTKEWNKLIKSGAANVFSPSQAREIRKKNMGGRIVKSRYVLTTGDWQNDEGCYYVAKARWCVKGYQDPDLMHVKTQAPTMSKEDVLSVLQSLYKAMEVDCC